MATYKRYAIYYTPQQGSPLAEFGARWLGWDLHQGCAVAHMRLRRCPISIEALTEHPRKYGFHATLKAPFYLNAAYDLTALQVHAANFAQSQTPFHAMLSVQTMGGFLMLRPHNPPPQLAQLGADCVTDFDRFRAPLTQDDLRRRRKSGLSAQQNQYLMDWGYPYVFDDFRFHITLSGPCSDETLLAVGDVLTDHLALILATAIPFDAITLCAQRNDGYFEVISHHPFGS